MSFRKQQFGAHSNHLWHRHKSFSHTLGNIAEKVSANIFVFSGLHPYGLNPAQSIVNTAVVGVAHL